MNKSVFWSYFKDKLRWPLLKSRYLQVIIKGLALYMDEIRHDMVHLRNQFHASKTILIDDFAASRGIKRYPSDSDAQFRTRVINAYRWQRLAGKEKGLPLILSEYGYPGAEIAYFKEPNRWSEFKVTFNEYNQDAVGIVSIVNEFKPARSKIGLIETPAASEGVCSFIGISAFQDSITSVRIAPSLYLKAVGYTQIKDYITSLKGD